MSHRSRVCAIFFDAESSLYEASARFWSGALGRSLEFNPDEKYTTLEGELEFIIQNANPGHEGMHIDIETDDVEAEVARLGKLGARKKYKIKYWWVMEAPGGHAFCVVPVYRKTWPEGVTEWD